MHKLNILLLFLFSVTGLVAQNSSMKFTGVPTQPENVKALETQFEQFEHVQFDATQLKKQLEGQEEVLFSLQLGEKTWDLHLLRMESRHRLITINGKDGKRTYPARNQAQVWRGYLRRDPTSTVSLTINDGFLYGMIIEKDEMFFIEPAEPFTKVSGQNFVVYNALDVKADMKDFCGVGELEKGMNQYAPDHDDHEHAHDHGNAETRSMMGCRELELAIAADFAMFQKYGSATGVQNRIDGVLANVQTNYDNEFNDEIAISTVEYFISNCSTCDPWTSSNSAGALLNSFRSWGQSGGFSVPFDLAGIWTNRNFSGSTIGIAFLSSVCFSTRYHAIQDFSNNAQVMRVLVSHEIGHNFSAQHDASGAPFIMAPSVNTSNAWSTASQNSINSFYPGLNCLGSCFVPIPPVADFTADFTEGCFPFTVDFTDLSQNSPTSWSWLFPVGTP